MRRRSWSLSICKAILISNTSTPVIIASKNSVSSARSSERMSTGKFEEVVAELKNSVAASTVM